MTISLKRMTQRHMESDTHWNYLNPFTAPACDISGLKSVHIHSCIFDGPTTNLLLILCILIEVLLQAHAKGKKILNYFKFGTFY